MDLYFLGTGGGVPSKERNVSSIALRLLQERGTIWLFDCGEATQQQILHSPVKLSKIDKIFITHLHGDHIYGLPGLLGSRSFQEANKPLTLYGPAGIRRFVETALAVSETHVRYPFSIIEVDDGLIFEDESFVVEALKLTHVVPSFGYRVTECDTPGALDARRLKQEGVEPGPVYGRLKNGETVQLRDGRVLNGYDYIGASKPGKKVAILGDTRPCEATVQLARETDAVVHEATFRESEAQMAHDYFHSTSVQAAKTARHAGASALILTHISSRYSEEGGQLLDEAARVFKTSYLAHDHLKFEI